jgi:hypothetical protein
VFISHRPRLKGSRMETLSDQIVLACRMNRLSRHGLLQGGFSRFSIFEDAISRMRGSEMRLEHIAGVSVKETCA